MRCRSAGIPVDGQWDKLDRRGLCLNDKIVKVKITDTCALFRFTRLSQRQTPSLHVHGVGSAAMWLRTLCAAAGWLGARPVQTACRLGINASDQPRLKQPSETRLTWDRH